MDHILSEHPEIVLGVVAAIANLIIFLGGLAWTIKRFGVEREKIRSEALEDKTAANKNLSQAGSEWLENYNRMFSMLQERDKQILEFSVRLGKLEASNIELQAKYETEHRLRTTAERERDRMADRLEALEDHFSTLQTSKLEDGQTILTLQTKILQLEHSLTEMQVKNGATVIKTTTTKIMDGYKDNQGEEDPSNKKSEPADTGLPAREEKQSAAQSNIHSDPATVPEPQSAKGSLSPKEVDDTNPIVTQSEEQDNNG